MARGLSQARATRAEADKLAERFDQDVRRALILWLIRWIVGFLLIWFVTAVSGGLGWLWWVGIIAAVASLIATLAIKRTMSRRFDSLNESFDELERVLRDDDA